MDINKGKWIHYALCENCFFPSICNKHCEMCGKLIEITQDQERIEKTSEMKSEIKSDTGIRFNTSEGALHLNPSKSLIIEKSQKNELCDKALYFLQMALIEAEGDEKFQDQIEQIIKMFGG